MVVFNVPDNFSKDEFYKLLEGVANITEISLPWMPNGQNKGYAIIYVKTHSEVNQAIEAIDNQSFEGKTLRASNKLLNTFTKTNQSTQMYA